MVEIALGTALAAIGAGVAIGFAGLGSGLGQGMAAAGSVGAVAEDNDMFARGIIFSALPETQAIYGFLIAILLLVFSGLLGYLRILDCYLVTCIFRIIRWRRRSLNHCRYCSYWCRCIHWICRFRFRYGSRYRCRHVRKRYYLLCITRNSGYLRILDCYLTYGIRWNISLGGL